MVDELARRFGAQLQKLAETDVRTPDFELLDSDGKRVAVIEVKLMSDSPKTAANGWTVKETGPNMRSYERGDNGPARVASHIHSAAGQLANAAEVRVVAFVNDDGFVDVQDLEEAVLGYLDYGDADSGFGYRNVVSRKIDEGRIREERWSVDLYVWFDRHAKGRVRQVYPAGGTPFTESTDDAPVFRCTSRRGHELAVQYFGCARVGRPDLLVAHPPDGANDSDSPRHSE